jgi:peptidoglycan hydrolase-like protein with peptidoglycan-binding domain
MHGLVWWAGSAAIAVSLCTPPMNAVAAGRMVELAQNASDAGQGATTPAASPANSPEQIKKAQIELRRLECLKGRVDGRLGKQTREAVKKYWASAKQPAGEVVITDELIAQLAERGDLYCRPARRFFGFGGRPGGNPAGLPFIIPGARPGPVPVPVPAVPPVAPDAAQ